MAYLTHYCDFGNPATAARVRAAWAVCEPGNQLVMVVTLHAPSPDAPPGPAASRGVVAAYEHTHPRFEIKYTPGATHAKVTAFRSARGRFPVPTPETRDWVPQHWRHARGEETLVALDGASPVDHAAAYGLLLYRLELRNEEFHDAAQPREHSLLVFDCSQD